MAGSRWNNFLPQGSGPVRSPVLLFIVCLLVLVPVSSCLAGTVAGERETKPDLMDMSVEELLTVEVATVFGASKYEQQVTEAPASVSIVTADDIRKYGYRTMADALRSVRGIYVTYDRNYSYLGVRGFNRSGDLDTGVLMLVDGHRINDNIFASIPIGTDFPVDLDLIDRIEVIRGPSSSLYGSNAFFGVVNVITKRPGELQGGQVAAAAGSFDTFNGRVSYGKAYGSGVGVLLSASGMHGDGVDRLYFKEFDSPLTNNGVAEHADADRNYQLFGKLAYRDFTLTGVAASREKTVPTAPYGTVFDDAHTRTTDGRRYLDLKFVHSFADDTELLLRAFYDSYSYDGDYGYDLGTTGAAPSLLTNKDRSRGEWWGSEAQVTRTLFELQKVTAGLDYRGNEQRQRNFDADPYASYLDDRRSSAIWALYLQDEIRLLDSLILSAGVRYDHYESFGGTTNPRFALIYKPVEGSVLKLLYGRAFRAPGVYELYYSVGPQVTNPQLKPERIQTYELVYEQYFLKHYRSSLSGFFYRITDLIGQDRLGDGSGSIRFDNIDTVDARGVELELEGTWENGLKGRLSYSYVHADDATTGRNLTDSPRHLAKLNLVLPVVGDRIFLGFEEQYQSSRATLAGNQTGDVLLSNATFSCRTPVRGLDLSLSVYNLFDAHYGDPGAPEHLQDIIMQDGISFRAKLVYNF